MRDTHDEKPTLSIAEAARLIGVGKNRMADAVRRGQIRSVLIGQRVLIPRSAVNELLSAR